MSDITATAASSSSEYDNAHMILISPKNRPFPARDAIIAETTTRNAHGTPTHLRVGKEGIAVLNGRARDDLTEGITMAGHQLHFGVAYYPEQDPEEEWNLDARLMRELGLNAIRIGEFCWSRMQRRDGTYTLDWIERCIEVFERHGIKTILCTPTAAPPVWLVNRYPDLPCITPDGRRGLFGGRRHYSVFHEGYRENCREIASALAERFGKHPAVIGWQLDNEVGSYSTIDCSPPALTAFHRWIENKYATEEELNKRWGLIFWNQEVESFDQVPAPTEMMCTRSPQYLLDYNRFMLLGMADFLLLQAAEVRRYAPQRQFIVACAIDIVQGTLHRLQRERGATDVDAVTIHNYPELMPEPGQMPMMLDFARSLHPSGEYLTLEHQLGSGHTTTGGFNPAVRRLWSFETLAHGSRAILWFHWRRFRTGPEWRHTAVVERDRRPREVYRGLQDIIREMRRIEPYLADAKVIGDAQVLFSLDNALARDRASEPTFWMEIQLPDAHRDRLPMWTRETLRTVYNPLCRLGMTLDIVNEADEWDTDRLLIVPDLDICTPALVEKLTDWCGRGGTLVCFPGAGERDEFGAQRDAPPPGILTPLFGVALKDYYPLEPDCGSAFDHMAGRAMDAAGAEPNRTITKVQVQTIDIPFDVRHGEVLELKGAQAIGNYTEGLYRGLPAVSLHKVGAGKAIYLGAVPANIDAAVMFYRQVLLGMNRHEFPYRRVTWKSPQATFAFLLNDRPVTRTLASPVQDLITGQEMTDLPPFGVALVRTG